MGLASDRLLPFLREGWELLSKRGVPEPSWIDAKNLDHTNIKNDVIIRYSKMIFSNIANNKTRTVNMGQQKAERTSKLLHPTFKRNDDDVVRQSKMLKEVTDIQIAVFWVGLVEKQNDDALGDYKRQCFITGARIALDFLQDEHSKQILKECILNNMRDPHKKHTRSDDSGRIM